MMSHRKIFRGHVNVIRWTGRLITVSLLLLILLYQHTSPARMIGYLDISLIPECINIPYHQELTAHLIGDKSTQGALILGKEVNSLWWPLLYPDTIQLGLSIENISGYISVIVYKGNHKVAEGIVDSEHSYDEKISLELLRPDLLSLGDNDLVVAIFGSAGSSLSFDKNENNKEHAEYAEIFLVEHLSGLEAINRWIQFSPFQSLLFCLVVFLLCCLAGISSISKEQTVSGIIIILAAYAFLPPVLSGNDETAHIDLLYRALHGTPKCNGAGDCPHFKRVGEYMISNGFYNLHKVQVQPVEQPPHFVLKINKQRRNAGFDQGAMNWYCCLVPLAKWVGISYDTPPVVLSMFVRLLYFLSFSFLFLACSWPASRSVTFAMGMIIIFSGGMLSQIGSITNDIPFYWSGILLGLVLIRQIAEKNILICTVLSVIFVSLLIYPLMLVDDSWIAFAPGLFFAVIVLVSKIFLKKIQWNIPIITIIIILFTCLLLFHDGVNTFVGEYMKQYTERYYHIFSLKKIVLLDAVKIFRYHFASCIGSFVWGHSFYPKWIIAGFAVFWTVYIAGGSWLTRHDRRWKKDFVLLDGYLASFVMYLLFVLIIAAPHVKKSVLWAMSDVRFVASSSFLLALPIAVITMRMAEISSTVNNMIGRVMFGTAALLIGIYTMQFYFIDLL